MLSTQNALPFGYERSHHAITKNNLILYPANITIIALPPKCHEPNPVENVWQFIYAR
jgi:transposase